MNIPCVFYDIGRAIVPYDGQLLRISLKRYYLLKGDMKLARQYYQQHPPKPVKLIKITAKTPALRQQYRLSATGFYLLYSFWGVAFPPEHPPSVHYQLRRGIRDFQGQPIGGLYRAILPAALSLEAADSTVNNAVGRFLYFELRITIGDSTPCIGESKQRPAALHN